LSRAQATRSITLQCRTGRVKAAAYRRTKFATRYTAADVDLLGYVDKAHGNLSGPATRRILEREYGDYGQAPMCGWLRSRLRIYTEWATVRRTASATPPIGPRGPRRFRSASGANPNRAASPAFCVHQGDQLGRKGLYHINAVDEVTQWEIAAATPQISELWLLPVLEAILEQFPFVIRKHIGFGYIDPKHAGAVDRFHREHLHPT